MRRRLCLALLAAPAAWAAPEAPRMGVYDSRAVAMAYAGSRFRRVKMDELKARHQQAVQAGDTVAATQLEAEGKAWQARLHRQGFGVASVDDLLQHIGEELPRIQQAARVTRLVSRWNLAELALHPLAERVDVTMELVDAFQPTPRQRQYAIDIQRKAPASSAPTP